MKEKIKQLIDKHGEDAVKQAANELLNKELQKLTDEQGEAESILKSHIERKMPIGYAEVLRPEKIQDALDMIDSAIHDVSTAGQAVEDSYKEKGELIRTITQMETSVKLKEAESLMMLEGEYAVIDGRKVKVKTAKEQDMYRRYATKEERQRLADLEAKLKALEVETYKAKDRWEEAKTTADLIKSRAYVQANLLKFLS